jgi:hypothetical protein
MFPSCSVILAGLFLESNARFFEEAMVVSGYSRTKNMRPGVSRGDVDERRDTIDQSPRVAFF